MRGNARPPAVHRLDGLLSITDAQRLIEVQPMRRRVRRSAVPGYR